MRWRPGIRLYSTTATVFCRPNVFLAMAKLTSETRIARKRVFVRGDFNVRWKRKMANGPHGITGLKRRCHLDSLIEQAAAN